MNYRCEGRKIMRFTVFKWWEALVKSTIYIMIFLATVGLIMGYCCIEDKDGIFAFSISIVYALALFFYYNSPWKARQSNSRKNI